MTFSTRIIACIQSVLIVLILNVSTLYAAELDSLRTEKIDGKLFIIHQVDPGETLYALSRRYKVSVPDIIIHNESAKLDIAVGAIIRIPLANPEVKIDTLGLTRHEVNAKETLFSLSRQYNISIEELKSSNNLVSNELSIGQILYINPDKLTTEAIEVATPTSSNKVTHQLEPGETLYSLTKKYNVSLEQLREWNNFDENNLSIGQILVVGMKEHTTLDEPTESNSDNKVDVANDTQTLDMDSSQTIATVRNVNGYEEIVETGIGEMIPGSTEARKYFGLHRTAKVGTMVKVRNEMNNRILYVRIIGRIPNTGDNKKVLIKISKAAYDRLGIIDKRFRAEISYMP